ncbi:hypothetical protein VTN49DRAFT_2407 [Thermomyces lanuginosus]|uniref:uncharacterized protein n=1 Tax=Thermomyces lanuginosus TaxID=5541 RepID=UPI0037433ADA
MPISVNLSRLLLLRACNLSQGFSDFKHRIRCRMSTEYRQRDRPSNPADNTNDTDIPSACPRCRHGFQPRVIRSRSNEGSKHQLRLAKLWVTQFYSLPKQQISSAEFT